MEEDSFCFTYIELEAARGNPVNIWTNGDKNLRISHMEEKGCPSKAVIMHRVRCQNKEKRLPREKE